MATKQIPFSEARQNLTSIVDEVEKLGHAVTIMRRGKAAAVIIDPATYNQFVNAPRRKKWMLNGSIIVQSGADIDRSLATAKEGRIRTWKERKEKLSKLLREP
jgi:prevent-host-death family protein